MSPQGHAPEKPGARTRHVPERSCLACGAKRAKGDLIRVVRSAANTIEIDSGGKKPGRGAYLCRYGACWEAGLKKGRLEHVLKCRLGPEDRESLGQYGKSLATDAGKSEER